MRPFDSNILAPSMRGKVARSKAITPIAWKFGVAVLVPGTELPIRRPPRRMPTYVFAIPANNMRWQTEIWKRGGAAWTYDKMGISAGRGWLTRSPILRVPQSERSHHHLQ